MSRISRSLLPFLAAVLVSGFATVLNPINAASAEPVVVNDPDASVTFQQSPSHDGHSDDPSFVAPFTERWSTTFNSSVGYPVIADGRVFVSRAHPGGYGVEIEARSVATGGLLWGPKYLQGPYWGGQLSYDAGQLFAVNWEGLLTAYDAQNGSVRWTTQLAGQFTAPPTATNGTLYLSAEASGGGRLYAVDEATGSTAWTAGVIGGATSAPAVDASGVYASYACGQAYKFDLAGTLVWHHEGAECSGGGGRTPVLHGGRVYIRDPQDAPSLVLDASTGEELGSFPAGPAPAFVGHHMVMMAGGVLTASDTETGETLWTTPQADYEGAPLIANGYVIEALHDGTIEALRVQDGQRVWSGHAGSLISFQPEYSVYPRGGLAQGDGVLVVPGERFTVFQPAGDPTVTITDGPPADWFTDGDATFDFTSDVKNPQYTCTLDGVSGPCSPPVTYTGLQSGTHTFSAAIAWATSGTARQPFQVDADAPLVQMLRWRSKTTTQRTVTVRWKADDWGSGIAAYQVRTRKADLDAVLPDWTEHAPTIQGSASFRMPRHSRFCAEVRAQDHVGNWSGWTVPYQCLVRR